MIRDLLARVSNYPLPHGAGAKYEVSRPICFDFTQSELRLTE